MKRLWLASGLFALAVAGCDHRAQSADAKSAQKPLGAADTARCSEGAALPIGALTVEWQQGDAVHRFAVTADGSVKHDGAPFGQLRGACLLDAQGHILGAVDANGVVADRTRARLGEFRTSPPIEMEGKAVALNELLTGPDGDSLAIDGEGTVINVPKAGAPFTMPAGVEGDVTSARRTALLLLATRPGFAP